MTPGVPHAICSLMLHFNIDTAGSAGAGSTTRERQDAGEQGQSQGQAVGQGQDNPNPNPNPNPNHDMRLSPVRGGGYGLSLTGERGPVGRLTSGK